MYYVTIIFISLHSAFHFISFKPVLSNQLPYVTIFHFSLGSSHKTGLTKYIITVVREKSRSLDDINRQFNWSMKSLLWQSNCFNNQLEIHWVVHLNFNYWFKICKYKLCILYWKMFIYGILHFLIKNKHFVVVLWYGSFIVVRFSTLVSVQNFCSSWPILTKL